MTRLKVLFITGWYPPLAGVFVREHAKAVQLYDDVVVLHCAGADPKSKRLWRLEEETDESQTEGLPTYRVWHRRLPARALSYPLYLWSVFRAFRWLAAHGFRPDVIHAHIYEAGVPAVLIGKLFRLPVVITEHWSAFPLGYLGRVGKLEARFAFRLADMVLPVSQALRASIEFCGIKANSRVIPNTYDDAVFYPNPGEKGANDCKRLLFVGNPRPVKGFPYLLEALACLLKKRRDWTLDIVGGGPHRLEYEGMTVELGLRDSVAFHGGKSKAEVARFMRRADFLLLPSLWENLPCVVIEAMATGLPVVATAVGGTPELVDKTNGILVPPKDVVGLCEGIAHAMDCAGEFDRGKIAQKAQQFRAEVVGRSIHSIYSECLR